MRNQPPTCLIVDDSAMDRAYMQRVIEHAQTPVQMCMARDVAEARRVLSERAISVIFLDNSMPDTSGVEFARELARHKDWHRLPVVMVTSWPSPFMYAKAKASNVLAIWSKDDFTTGAVRKIVRDYGRVH